MSFMELYVVDINFNNKIILTLLMLCIAFLCVGVVSATDLSTGDINSADINSGNVVLLDDDMDDNFFANGICVHNCPA